eukprot:symbB.v1.2.038741.t1/scaffold6153.1/size20491/1
MHQENPNRKKTPFYRLQSEQRETYGSFQEALLEVINNHKYLWNDARTKAVLAKVERKEHDPVQAQLHEVRRSPSYGERAQAAGYQLKKGVTPPLIPFEMEPGEAVRFALSLTHPFTGTLPIDPDLQECLSLAVRFPEWLNSYRKHVLAFWEAQAIRLLPETEKVLSQVEDRHLRRLLRGQDDHCPLQLGSCFHIALWKELMAKANSIDTDLVDQMLQGMSIVGDIARSRRWPTTQGTEDLSLDNLRSRAWEFSAKVNRNVARSEVTQHTEKVWEATMEDVAEKLRSGLFTVTKRSKAHEQKAIALLQKNIRGAITRKRIQKELKGEVFEPSESSTTPEIAEKSAKGEDEENHLHDLIANPEDEAVKNLKPEALEGANATTEMAGGVGFAILQRRRIRRLLQKQVGQKTQHLRELSEDGTSHWTIQRTYRGRLYGRRPMQEMREAAMKIQAMARGVALREQMRGQHRAAAYAQAHWNGYQAGPLIQLDVKVILYDKMETLACRCCESSFLSEFLMNSLSVRKCLPCYAFRRKQKAEADKRISTLLTAFYMAAGEIRHYIHPWWRHLPSEIQEVLSQVKASMQRTIGLVHVSGKLANEEIGKRGLRVSGAEHLVYDSEQPDLVTHMLLSVTRHLLNQIAAEHFPVTVDWACYAISHQAVKLALSKSFIPREIIPVGKEIPPHPGDTLATLWETSGTVKHHHDWLITLSEESLPCLVLSGLPASHRHVSLTAEVLITMRQALESPTVSTEDHLRFQGLDAQAGAQMMEVLGSELDHRLPPDWTQQHGTVAALSVVLSNHMKDLSGGEKDKDWLVREDGKAGMQAKAKAKSRLKAEPKGRTGAWS